MAVSESQIDAELRARDVEREGRAAATRRDVAIVRADVEALRQELIRLQVGTLVAIVVSGLVILLAVLA